MIDALKPLFNFQFLLVLTLKSNLFWILFSFFFLHFILYNVFHYVINFLFVFMFFIKFLFQTNVVVFLYNCVVLNSNSVSCMCEKLLVLSPLFHVSALNKASNQFKGTNVMISILQVLSYNCFLI